MSTKPGESVSSDVQCLFITKTLSTACICILYSIDCCPSLAPLVVWYIWISFRPCKTSLKSQVCLECTIRIEKHVIWYVYNKLFDVGEVYFTGKQMHSIWYLVWVSTGRLAGTGLSWLGIAGNWTQDVIMQRGGTDMGGTGSKDFVILGHPVCYALFMVLCLIKCNISLSLLHHLINRMVHKRTFYDPAYPKF